MTWETSLCVANHSKNGVLLSNLVRPYEFEGFHEVRKDVKHQKEIVYANGSQSLQTRCPHGMFFTLLC
jgi:hypothetical protein